MERDIEVERAREAIEKISAAIGGAPELAPHLAVLDALVRVFASLRDRADAQTSGEARLRANYAALMKMARSEAIERGALDEALREITEHAASCLDVARSSVWLYNADQTSIQCVELFLRRERAHESGVELFARDYPTYFEALGAERTIAAADAHRDPRTSCFSESYLGPLGIGSMLDAPIRVGGRMIGVVCNEHVGPPRLWTLEDEQFAASMADFVALAIESASRRETEAQLRAMAEALGD
jgi:GAF domain-containing protein